MAQKILVGRVGDRRGSAAGGGDALAGDVVEARVDHVVLARDPSRAVEHGVAAGLKKTSVEVAIAYETTCVTDAAHPRASLASEVVPHGVVVGRAGVGFASMVHLERFASPARLCVTDDPRLAGVGGIGMLSLVLPPALLGQALATGTVWLRPPKSIQVTLTGKMRPFVCARDVALELVRRGIADTVRSVEAQYGAPVVIELTGPSARLLSVGDRAVLASIAPMVGAAAALFVADERTEVFLRDQRRSKAHRALVPDAGAPVAEVVALDLAAVDPLLLDENGVVRGVRDLAGKPVGQVILGGDSGVTLRDLFAAALLLKSKRVPPRVDLLLAIPSRQMLEVMAGGGALADLVASGARLVEPDARIVTGGLYPPPAGSVSLRTFDPEPRAPGARGAVVASAETIAWSVATGAVGDPRGFKRPVRVTLPRVLPTDDVLVVRDRKAADASAKREPLAPIARGPAWKASETLDVVGDVAAIATAKKMVVVVCNDLEDVRRVASRAFELAPRVRAVVASYVPSALATMLAAAGIAAFEGDVTTKGLAGQKSATLPAPSSWAAAREATVAFGTTKLPVVWRANARERAWITDHE